MSEESDAIRFRDAERRTLAAVLDALIPPAAERGLPGAGALGLAEYVETTLCRAPAFLPPVREGLAALDALAADRGAADFADLDAAARSDVLNELSTRDPGFLPGLMFHTYAGYYHHPRVVEALGHEPRPPHPQGYALAALDASLLEPVRRRAKLYRDV